MPSIRLRPDQETIRKDIEENNNGWKYYKVRTLFGRLSVYTNE